jgi:hypothetical protein
MENQARIEELLTDLLKKFELPTNERDLLTTRIGYFGTRMDSLTKKVDGVITKLEILAARIDELSTRVEELRE